MNIRNDLQPIQPVSGDTQVSSAMKMAGSGGAASSPSDQAHLSSAASLAIHAASLPDVRAEKVASMQAAIAGGSYSVSSADVASSLVNYMLGRQR